MINPSTQVVGACNDRKKLANQTKHKFINLDLPGVNSYENIKKRLKPF